ncbi:MAG: RecX family transcriptional regulator, partial [Clostridia bacterium]
ALTHINMEEMETAAFTLATRLYGRMQGQADDVARRKVAQALARRGYEWDTIHRMIARLPERKQDDDDFPEE